MREAIGGALTYSPFTLAWNGYEPVHGIVLKNGSPPFTLATIIGVSITHAASSLVSSSDPTYKRGSGDIGLIPQASLTLITFWREISLCQSHCRITICSATLEVLGCFGTMTQHFFWRVN